MDFVNLLLLFGTFFYMVTCVVSSYVACVGKIDRHETSWVGKLVVYYGIFNIAFWSCTILSLVIRKLGIVLLT